MKDVNLKIISVCLCTYKRELMLKKCLESILRQTIKIDIEVIVIDNDYEGSAKKIIDYFTDLYIKEGILLKYAIEPQQGLSSARNHSVLKSSGDFIAFIDDDEYADAWWLENLYTSLIKYNADAVWGSIIPVFDEGFPNWQKVFFKRQQKNTGSIEKQKELSTANLIIKRDVLFMRKYPFDVKLNQMGGEDTDLFNYLLSKKSKFIWCNEAIVYEHNPIERSRLLWHIRRAYRGGWGFSLQKHKYLGLYKSLFLVLLWIIPATLKNFLYAICYKDIRTISLAWLKEIFAEGGKLGYYFNIKVFEYKKKAD